MKRILLLAVWTVLLISVQLFVNCSNPLETDNSGPDPVPPGVDTIYRYDTVTLVDTVIGDDTVIVTDTFIDTFIDEITVIVVDTLVDTVVIYEPDPGTLETVCSILRGNLREIIWMFRNQADHYLLEFEASQSREFEMYTLLININGQVYEWDLVDGPTYSIELDLPENSTIRVMPDKPLLLGHQVDLCLTISKP